MTHRTLSRTLALASAMALAPVATGEHVELTITLGATPGDTVPTLGAGVATVVFDTDEPPVASDLQSVTFAGVSGSIEAVVFAVSQMNAPSALNPDPVRVSGPIDSATLTYNQAGQRNLGLTLTRGEVTFRLNVFEPAGSFSPTMGSLPDEAAAYAVLDPTDFIVFASLLTPAGSVFASLDRSGSFVSSIGGVSYNVRLVEPPAPSPCNAADLAEPLGSLDFDDVLAFLTAFAQGDAAADLAEPGCVFDFDDVLGFLTAFGAGCP